MPCRAALRDSLRPGRPPVTRTHTLRRADARRQQVDIDFVVHGDKGIAAPWAACAEPGDLLTLSSAGGAYRPDPGEYLDATPPSGVQVSWLHRPDPGSEQIVADGFNDRNQSPGRDGRRRGLGGLAGDLAIACLLPLLYILCMYG
jgi:NADPH-dependent ferric siderophore reductase